MLRLAGSKDAYDQLKALTRGRAVTLADFHRLLDESALESYCVTYAKWREAEQRLADEGLTILTPNGCTQAHPCQSISNQAQKLLLAWVKAFGLSPDSRGRMDISSSPQVQADADFLVKIKNSVGR